MINALTGEVGPGIQVTGNRALTEYCQPVQLSGMRSLCKRHNWIRAKALCVQMASNYNRAHDAKDRMDSDCGTARPSMLRSWHFG